MSKVTLFSARACPFAHRTRLVLSEKHIEFELKEIDLQNKPAWFDQKVSGYGKVPAIEHEGVYLWESAVINEYLNEVFPEPALLPSAPAQRAQARILIDYANTRFTSAFGALLRAPDEQRAQTAQQELSNVLAFIEDKGFGVHSGAGPFILGANVSLVDFTFYPWFERWPALAHYRNFPIPEQHTRIARWLGAISDWPSIKAHQNPPDYYLERYARAVAPKTVA